MREWGKALVGPLKTPDDTSQKSQEWIEQWTKLAAEFPAQPSFRKELALARRSLAEQLRAFKDRLGDAEKLHLQSLAELNELAKEFPEEPQYIEQAGHSYRFLGWIARCRPTRRCN